MPRNKLLPFIAGVLVANSVPHLMSAVARKKQLTPLAGYESSPEINLLWGGMNLAAGSALLKRSTDSSTSRWGKEKTAFAAGVAAFSVWAAFAERLGLFQRAN